MSSGQRHVILVRHAHAEWPAYAGTDLDRPLTPQGVEDARSAAAAILESAHRPDLLLTSPARRTLQTARIIATTLELPDAALRQIDALYNATPEVLDAELLQAFAAADTVLLVAHNPGISALARKLTGDSDFVSLRPGHWLQMPYRCA